MEKHHPDKENKPSYWIWLCSNCHSKVSRKQTKERTKQKAERQQVITIPTKLLLTNTAPIKSHTQRPIDYDKLSKLEKVLLWSVVIGIPTVERLVNILQKRRQKRKHLVLETEIDKKMQENIINAIKKQTPQKKITQSSESEQISPRRLDKTPDIVQRIIDSYKRQ